MSDSESDTSVQSESSNESDNDFGLSPYMFEPTYSNQNYDYDDSESSQIDEEEEEESESEGDEQGRVGNTSWCQCGKCELMDTETESICCMEVEGLDENRFESKSCITEVEEFKAVCLHSAVIRTVLIAYRYHVDELQRIPENFENKNMRFGCYKQFTYWVYNRLGRGIRKVIPSCVIWAIRNSYPDSDGNYVEFEE